MLFRSWCVLEQMGSGPVKPYCLVNKSYRAAVMGMRAVELSSKGKAVGRSMIVVDSDVVHSDVVDSGSVDVDVWDDGVDSLVADDGVSLVMLDSLVVVSSVAVWVDAGVVKPVVSD